MMQIPQPAPATTPDEKEAAAAPQDSHSSTIDPDPILHITPAPAAAPPVLTDGEKSGIKLLEGEFMRIVTADGPGQITNLEDRLLKFNQTLRPQLTPELVRDVINQEQAKLEQKIFETGVHPAKLRDLIRKCHKFGESDASNGERFAARWAETAKYCHLRKAWYLWDGTCWREDQERAVYRKAKVTARAIYSEVELFLPDEDAKRRERSKWAGGSAGKKRLEDMLFMATCDEKIGILPDRLDAKSDFHDLFNLQNGTLDLKAPVTFREHRKDDLLTKMAGVAYDPAADCPLWDAHLRLIFGGKEDLIQAFQEHTGYCLLAGNPENVFEIWHGNSGDNGKSVTLSTLRAVLGEYATHTSADTFMENRQDSASARPELMALRGARLVTAVETEEGRRLAEGMIKQMTGGDPISARGLFRDQETFPALFTPILATNHKPIIRGMDGGIWRRIRLWPFTVKITEEQKITDYDRRLTREGSGILNWMIEGLRRYYAAGTLAKPAELMANTNEYRAQQDVLKGFIPEMCTVLVTERCLRTDLHQAYVSWCVKYSEDILLPKDFYSALREHNFNEWRGTNGRYFIGIRLKTPEELLDYQNGLESGSVGYQSSL